MYSFPNLEWVHVVPCLVLAVASWPACRFLRKQDKWSDIPISLRIFQVVVIHTVKGFSIVNEAEVDVFLEFLWFFNELMKVDNLTSGFYAFSKAILYIWKFSVHILLKLSLKDFEHFLASICSCMVVWTFFGIALLWDWNENSAFIVLWTLLNLANLLPYWEQHFNSIIF